MTHDRHRRDSAHRHHDRYAGEDFRRDRQAREPFWRGVDEDRGLRSPDREFETSAPYRQPRDEATWYSAPPYAPSYAQDSGLSGRYRARDGGAVRGGFAGRGPKDYVRTDARIREDVCERLSWDDEVDATDVSVIVTDGEVTLEGTVETRHMKRLAEDLAESVAGVQDVHNSIRVRKAMLTELKEKITGETREEHFANTGTKTTGPTTTYQAGR